MKTFLISLLLIVSLGFGFGCYWIQKHGDDYKAIITNFFGSNTVVSEKDKDLDEDTIHTFVINYYANKDSSGAEMLEIKLTSYTDYEMKGVYSTGIQIINPTEMKAKRYVSDSNLNIFGGYDHTYHKYKITHQGEVRYFNSVDGLSFKATDKLESNDDLYIIDIDKVPYAFNFNKTTIERSSYSLWINDVDYFVSDFDYFVYQIYNTIKSCPEQKTYLDLPLKFDDVFQLYEYNETTKKFDIQSTKGYSQEFVTFKFNYYTRGAISHKDSLFGLVGCDVMGGVIWG